MQVFLTGHSLGGALANLAAYDVAKALESCSKMTRVICYTFGAPRTGNHAFADDYNRVVPDTWCIINDQVTGCHVLSDKSFNGHQNQQVPLIHNDYPAEFDLIDEAALRQAGSIWLFVDNMQSVQDAVARNAKFWVLYKRPGQRVLINDRGDMLVRPSFAELSIQQSPAGSSVTHVSFQLSKFSALYLMIADSTFLSLISTVDLSSNTSRARF